MEDAMQSRVTDDGRAALVEWLRAAYPGLQVDDENPIEYPVVSLNSCRAGTGKVIERWDMIDVTIAEIKDDGTIVWEFRKLRVRPWWRALYRWWRWLIRKPLPGPPGGRDEARPIGPHIQGS